MNQETIAKLASNESLQEAIKEGTPYRVKIMTDLGEQMKEVKDAYVDALAECDDDGIAAVLKKADKEDADHERIKEWKKKVNKQFGTVKHIIHPNPGQDVVGSIVDKIVSVAQMLKYIGRTDLEDRLAQAGITLSIKTLEQVNPKFDNDVARAKFKQLWADADEIQGEICTNADKIKIDCFESVDESVRYSKENRGGLKKGDFCKLVKNKAIGQIKSNEVFTKYMDKERKHNQHEIDKNQLMLESNKQI